jgi:hypothetical protein
MSDPYAVRLRALGHCKAGVSRRPWSARADGRDLPLGHCYRAQPSGSSLPAGQVQRSDRLLSAALIPASTSSMPRSTVGQSMTAALASATATGPAVS